MKFCTELLISLPIDTAAIRASSSTHSAMLAAISLASTAFSLAPSLQLAPAVRVSPAVMNIRESRVAKVKEYAPGERYRAADQPAKYYEGRDKQARSNLQKALKDVGKRKVVVLTGCSSGLGYFCIQALVRR